MAALSRAPLLSALRQTRCFHSSSFRAAVAHPITAHGPPPKAPASAQPDSKLEQKADQTATDNAASTNPSRSQLLKKRFWKDVHVHGKQGMTDQLSSSFGLNISS